MSVALTLIPRLAPTAVDLSASTAAASPGVPDPTDKLAPQDGVRLVDRDPSNRHRVQRHAA